MQIGVTVSGFQDIGGLLFYTLNVKFNHPTGQRGEISGTVPITSTRAQAEAEVKTWILDNYGIAVPGNALVRTVGL